MKRSELLTKEEILNAVIDILSEYEYPTEDKNINEIWTIFQYYTGMESGGHESLFTQNSGYIEEVGALNYVEQLVSGLEKIGAHEYAILEEDYALRLWSMFLELEEDERIEEMFYEAIENADNMYFDLEGDLEERLERYFVHIYLDLIEVNEDE